jgi:hypothetical protein
LVNSRTKGKSFEQDIARDLRAWLGDDWTVERNQTDRQAGDTGTAGEFNIRHRTGAAGFPWCIECKAYADWDEGQLWRVPVVGPVPRFWKQAVRQAAAVGLRPLLIAKRNRGEVLVFRCAEEGAHRESPQMAIVLDGETVLVSRWADFVEDRRGGK